MSVVIVPTQTRGSIGSTGATGPSGHTGATGATGPQGPQGSNSSGSSLIKGGYSSGSITLGDSIKTLSFANTAIMGLPSLQSGTTYITPVAGIYRFDVSNTFDFAFVNPPFEVIIIHQLVVSSLGTVVYQSVPFVTDSTEGGAITNTFSFKISLPAGSQVTVQASRNIVLGSATVIANGGIGNGYFQGERIA